MIWATHGAGCVLVCDHRECCYLPSPVFSPRSKFVLTWPNVTPESGETGARLGPLLSRYWLDTGLLTTRGSELGEWILIVFTVQLTMGTKHKHRDYHTLPSWAWLKYLLPKLIWRILGDHDWCLLILSWLALLAHSRCHEARKWSQEVNHWLVTIAACNQWIKSS